MGAEGNGHDRIEREILIDAPIELVWRLVSEPGWWIGDGDRSHQIVTHVGDLVVVDDPRYGRWSVLPVSSQAPHHVSYRWPVVAGQPLEPATSTLVEFFLSEHGDGTRLRVVESGFASLDRAGRRPGGQRRGQDRGLAAATRRCQARRRTDPRLNIWRVRTGSGHDGGKCGGFR